MISRDRDRVLVAGTVAGLLAKYRVELGGAAELLLGRHEETEREQFRGMVNYEDLVRSVGGRYSINLQFTIFV